jgi:thiamine biosynthesis lipoprotein
MLRGSRIVMFVFALALSMGACGPTDPPPPAQPAAQLVEDARVEMGSELRLTAWTADEAAAHAAFEEVFKEFERLDALMSVWREGSDVLRINAAAGDHPVRVSTEVLDVLGVAQQIGDWTDGKFDITFGALADAWKFDQDQDNTIPTRAQITARIPLVDYTKVQVDPHDGSVFVARKGMRIHLGGIGKGYALDRAVSILRDRNLQDFMIQAGGDMYVSGRHGDRLWRLGIRDPRGPADRSFATLDLTDSTFSTSGDYERSFMSNGRRYHHILDPDLGEPARLSRSVTIVSRRAVLADGLSTGVFVLGPAKGMALIERLPDVEGVIVSETNEVLISSGLRNRITLHAQPTDAP